MKKLGVILISMFIALFTLGSLSHIVFASAADDVCSGIGSVDAAGNCAEPSGSGSVQNAIVVAVNILSWVVGIAATIVVIFGGFRYITSGGDSAKVSSAKNAILYALVGLIVVALAQVIVRFTLNKTGAASSPTPAEQAPDAPVIRQN